MISHMTISIYGHSQDDSSIYSHVRSCDNPKYNNFISSFFLQPGNPAVASTNLPKPMVVPSNTCLSQPPAKNQPTRIAAMGRSHVQPASLNSIGSKPVQSESKPGGRHPQPPDATNTKLKHKVCMCVCVCVCVVTCSTEYDQ